MFHIPKLPCSGELYFRGLRVRYVTDADRSVWLAARDIINMLGLDSSRSLSRWLAPLPEADCPFRSLPTSHGLQRSRMISPQGAIALIGRRKRPIEDQVRSFLKHYTGLIGPHVA